MALYDDSKKTCVDCGQGTYIEYADGLKCRYCGEPVRKRTPAKGKTDD